MECELHICRSLLGRAVRLSLIQLETKLLLVVLFCHASVQAGVLRDHVSDSSCWQDTQLIDNSRCADPKISATAWTLVEGDGGELAEVSIVGTPILYPSGDAGSGSSLTNFSRWKIIVVPEGSPSLPCYTNSGVIPTNPDYPNAKAYFFEYGIHKVSLAITNSGYPLESGRRYRVSLTPEADATEYEVFFCAVQSRGEGASIGTTVDLYESGTEGWPLTSLRDLDITYDYFAYRVVTMAPAARLRIKRLDASHLEISWPTGLQQQGLYETADLIRGPWSQVAGSISTNIVTVSVLPGANRFYRLGL